MMNNCPYIPENRRCRLEVDYLILEESLRESEETLRQLLNANRYLWNRLDKIEEFLAALGISIADI